MPKSISVGWTSCRSKGLTLLDYYKVDMIKIINYIEIYTWVATSSVVRGQPLDKILDILDILDKKIKWIYSKFY